MSSVVLESNDDTIEQLLWQTRRQYNAWLDENKDVVFNATTWIRPILAHNVTRNYEALCRGDIGNVRCCVTDTLESISCFEYTSLAPERVEYSKC